MKLIPRYGYLHENAFSWWVAGDPCRKIGESGRLWPEGDWICDRFENVTLGEPERAAPPGTGGDRDAPQFPPSLSMVLPYRILALAEDHPAIREEDAEDILGEKPEAVDAAFTALVKDGLLARVQDVYYLGGSAFIHVAARDRIPVTSVRQRLLSYLDEDMRRHLHGLAHNRGMRRIVRSLRRHGIKVYGGWRGVQSFPRIDPDSAGRAAVRRRPLGENSLLPRVRAYRNHARAGLQEAPALPQGVRPRRPVPGDMDHGNPPGRGAHRSAGPGPPGRYGGHSGRVGGRSNRGAEHDLALIGQRKRGTEILLKSGKRSRNSCAAI